jgi:hypothetical protein
LFFKFNGGYSEEGMVLIAQNNLQFILEVAVIMQFGIMILFNLLPISLSFVLFLSLIVAIALTFLFGVDALGLFIHGLGFHEFTHTYGPIALMVIVTLWTGIVIMQKSRINVQNLKVYLVFLMIIITIVGGLMHRDFLLLWLMGLFIGFFIISKSFRQKSVFTVRRIVVAIGIIFLSFASLEVLSRLLSMSILSPMLRIERLLHNALPSLQMVIKNTTLYGHIPGSSYWGSVDLGSSSGYIALPISLIILFGLPFQIFYGVLVTKKDQIDYFLPGIYGVAFDFGYIALVLLLIWCVFVIVVGFRILKEYRRKRESGNRTLFGREALLVGSLTAFIAQAINGLFIMNREINGTALITFIFLSSMVISHLLLVKR